MKSGRCQDLWLTHVSPRTNSQILLKDLRRSRRQRRKPHDFNDNKKSEKYRKGESQKGKKAKISESSWEFLFFLLLMSCGNISVEYWKRVTEIAPKVHRKKIIPNLDSFNFVNESDQSSILSISNEKKNIFHSVPSLYTIPVTINWQMCAHEKRYRK